jgi:hypothetical protein
MDDKTFGARTWAGASRRDVGCISRDNIDRNGEVVREGRVHRLYDGRVRHLGRPPKHLDPKYHVSRHEHLSRSLVPSRE